MVMRRRSMKGGGMEMGRGREQEEKAKADS
jgi:hypothetical protein